MNLTRPTVVVVPCFNEAARLKPDAFVTAVQEHPSLQFLFVEEDRPYESARYRQVIEAAIRKIDGGNRVTTRRAEIIHPREVARPLSELSMRGHVLSGRIKNAELESCFTAPVEDGDHAAIQQRDAANVGELLMRVAIHHAH